MYLKDSVSGDLVEVLEMEALFDPCRDSILGRFHAGEELQEPARFKKISLSFPSDEALPRCWVDAGYRFPIAR